ncbi:putative nucleotidyltransferase substrate binding domain-containing protein [Geobacter sp. AOG1]|uniref:putative nucleotidyltransferase substrate binding domain-containing protein n=1 Tax=Geobacter sp. AOG1 TaxID=1566346 RepID=UPI001CC71013|nr:putative nucleotidyltransferase substrate binding domain-containing protein [Geobacter sp. AOG1]GFE56195.1 nucleotidyltransferase [Geobacter sp. AOG1]
MSMFPVNRGGDILAWRDTVELVDGVKRQLSQKMAYLLDGDELVLLRGLQERLGEEMAVESRFAEDVEQVLSALETAGSADEMAAGYRHGKQLAADYFEQRGSVLVVQSFCSTLQDLLIRRALVLAGEWMARSGFGSPPVPYCWFAFGGAGRAEGTIAGECDALLVHGELNGEHAAYFAGFSLRVIAILENCGVKSVAGITPVHPSWRGSINEWRSRLIEGAAGEKMLEDHSFLARFADLRLVSGDSALYGETMNLIRSLFDFNRRGFDEVARGAAEMATGLDFFGRLRVAKGGEHRGEFNLEQLALGPLVENIRILAVRAGLPETATVERIKSLLGRGELDVDLSQRLLRAYHDFVSQKLRLEIRRNGEGAFFKPEELDEAKIESLKEGVEAVVNLQRIVYQRCVVNG